MEFFNQAIDILKILVMALGAGLAVWGVINLLEGYGSEAAHGGRRCRSDRPSAYPSAVRPVQLSVTRCPFSRKGADVWTLSSTQSLNG